MLTRGFVVLWIAMLMAMAGIGMVSPLLPIFVREDLGGPEIAVALSFSGVAVAQLFLSPFVGRLGDRFGVKWFLVVGFFIYAITGFGYLAVSTWEQVVALRIFSGVGIAVIFPLSSAYVGRLAPPGREGELMGAFSVAQILGFGVGPLMGGIVRDSLGSDIAFFSMAMMLMNTGLLVMLLLPPRPRPQGVSDDYEEVADPQLSFRELIRRRFVQAVMVSGVLGSLSFAASGAFLAVYVVSEEGLGTGSVAFVGVLFGARSLMGVIIEPFSGRLADRVDRVNMVMIGMIGAAIAQFLVPSVPSGTTEISLLGVDATIVPGLLVVYLALGVAEAIAFPAQSAIFVTVGRVTGMASVMGLQQMAWAIGFLGGSLLGALVVAMFGIENVFRYAGILTIVGAGIFFIMIRRAGDEIREAERIGVATLADPGPQA
jgi:DHA1 family multidrug resistance protein-like MFS transporter